MLRRIALVATLLSGIAQAQDHELIGGTVADPKDWLASPFVGNCSSTVIGEQVLLTAAHCVANGGGRAFTYGGVRYSGSGCVHHPEYKGGGFRGNATADWALCKITEPVKGMPFESIASRADFDCRMSASVLWTGFGCTRWGNGIDGKFRTGSVDVIRCPTGSSYDTVTRGAVALCSGDSGGGGYVVFPDGSRKVIGVNSRSNTTDTSYVSSTYTDTFRNWAKGWADQRAVKICGIHEDARFCRGEEDPGNPDPIVLTKPIYRHYNAAAYDHYYSESPTPPAGYQAGGVVFKLYKETRQSALPLNRCFKGGSIGHWLTLSYNCDGQGVTPTAIGYVVGGGSEPLQPLMRCKQVVSPTRTHFLTTATRAECDQSGHTFEGYQGFAPL